MHLPDARAYVRAPAHDANTNKVDMMMRCSSVIVPYDSCSHTHEPAGQSPSLSGVYFVGRGTCAGAARSRLCVPPLAVAVASSGADLLPVRIGANSVLRHVGNTVALHGVRQRRAVVMVRVAHAKAAVLVGAARGPKALELAGARTACAAVWSWTKKKRRGRRCHDHDNAEPGARRDIDPCQFTRTARHWSTSTHVHGRTHTQAQPRPTRPPPACASSAHRHRLR